MKIYCLITPTKESGVLLLCTFFIHQYMLASLVQSLEQVKHRSTWMLHLNFRPRNLFWTVKLQNILVYHLPSFLCITASSWLFTYSNVLNNSSYEIRVMCGKFQKILIILSGIIVLCGNFQNFWEKLLTLWALLFTFLRVITVLCGNMAKINNSSEANKLILSGKIFKN